MPQNLRLEENLYKNKISLVSSHTKIFLISLELIKIKISYLSRLLLGFIFKILLYNLTF